MSKLTALVLVIFTVAATPASATDFCIVKKSADGFVALRAQPSSQGALIARANAGQAVVIQKNESGDQIVQSSWIRVLHFADTTVPAPADPKYSRGQLGWMHKRYIDDCG